MVRRCARPACNAPAVVTFTFDGLHRVLWLGPLAEAAAYSAGDLCARHADSMTAPRNWEVRDHRRAVEPVEPTGAAAPSRFQAPPPAPAPEARPQSLPLEPVPMVPAASTDSADEEPEHELEDEDGPERKPDRPAAAVPAIPRAGAAPELHARTRMLERAFRAANTG